MSTVNVSTSSAQSYVTEVSSNVSNVNYMSTETVKVTEVTVTKYITKATENKTEAVTSDATNEKIKETTVTDHTSGSSSYFTHSDFITDNVTDVTFYESSQLITDQTSTALMNASVIKSTTTSVYVNNSSQPIFTNTNPNFSVNTVETGTSVGSSAIDIQKLCADCTTTVVLVSAVSAGVVLLVLLMSTLCFFRLRHKWRAKIQLERKKTDIWSMATYNNTIINENFNDYQLASPTSREFRKSSKISENSIHFYDPSSGTTPQAQFSSNQDAIVLRSDTLPPEVNLDNSTLRRNTVSAPEELDLAPKLLGFNDTRYTLRGRSSTFTVGRKQNVDQHVLLSHEELIDEQASAAVYTTPTNSYYTTEL